MLNLDNVLAALDLMHHDKGQCISYRNMTISTCGIVPGIEEMTRQGRTINLAVSPCGNWRFEGPPYAYQREVSFS